MRLTIVMKCFLSSGNDSSSAFNVHLEGFEGRSSLFESLKSEKKSENKEGKRFVEFFFINFVR